MINVFLFPTATFIINIAINQLKYDSRKEYETYYFEKFFPGWSFSSNQSSQKMFAGKLLVKPHSNWTYKNGWHRAANFPTRHLHQTAFEFGSFADSLCAQNLIIYLREPQAELTICFPAARDQTPRLQTGHYFRTAIFAINPNAFAFQWTFKFGQQEKVNRLDFRATEQNGARYGASDGKFGTDIFCSKQRLHFCAGVVIYKTHRPSVIQQLYKFSPFASDLFCTLLTMSTISNPCFAA